ncbi:cytochrome P450 CYP72A616-like [Populus alba]|uniref:cytochrome P450 CYP72A616-like n=1 Tax=Populus alba TaxID=43335 RepID=UPI003CC77FB9
MVLALHPEWQEMAREEVLQVCGQNEPNFEALTHLKIAAALFSQVNMILNEVLRLYPPVISLCQHTYKDTGIGNIHLPAGVDLALPMLLIHHDPEPWEPVLAKKFAMLEAKMALAMILQNFEFNLSPSYIHAPPTVMILQPQHGAQIIIHQL